MGVFAHLGEDCYLIQWFRGTRKGGGKDRILQTRQRGEARQKMKRHMTKHEGMKRKSRERQQAGDTGLRQNVTPK